jgi:hypothetical protein
MSHSTEIQVKIGLDSHTLYCGSRGPAEACGVAVGSPKTFKDDEALKVLWNMPHKGAGRMALFGVLHDIAISEKYMRLDSASVPSEANNWLEVTVFHYD